ncbi:MAG TPA: NUDIX domain-containing protein [Ktedonobacteraceae bacterium]|nr:NUDIX domain-containing protein [Ktedonobacteraceae bacterium]
MPEQQNEQARPMVGVSVLISNGDRVLLERRSKDPMKGAWKAPGGHMEFGETPEQTAMREVQEELGVTLSDLKFRTITNDVFEAEKKHYITIWMDAHIAAGEPKLQAPYEETEIGWFTWDALPQPLYLPIQHLLEGKTYPSQTTDTKIGAAIETTPILPGAGSEALRAE